MLIFSSRGVFGDLQYYYFLFEHLIQPKAYVLHTLLQIQQVYLTERDLNGPFSFPIYMPRFMELARYCSG